MTVTSSQNGAPNTGPWHLRGTVLPEGQHWELWIRDGVISHSPVPGALTLTEDAYLIPGLVDAHCHPGLAVEEPHAAEQARAQALADRDSGTLLIRDCGMPIDIRFLQQQPDVPRIIRAGQHLAVTKRYLPGMAIELDDPKELPRAVAEQARAGDGWVKLVGDWIERSAGDLTPLWSDAVLAEAVRAAHEAGARVTAHVFGEAALPGLVAAGIDCLEHATGLLSAGLVDEVARRGIAVVPTLINIETFPAIAEAAAKYPSYAAHMRSLHAGVGAMVAAAAEAGVALYAGTDAGGTIEHGRIVDEIAALHGAGLTRAEALGAACWHARDWLDAGGPGAGGPGAGGPGAGALAEGAPADLLVLRGDPRTDLSLLRAPERIVLRGALVR